MPAPPAAEDLQVVLVAAVAENRVIGRDGAMPWHYPADLERFREATMNHPVVMGRRTFEAIVDRLGEPLPGRTTVVLTTRDLDLPAGAVRAGGIEEALETAREALAERHPDADRTAYVAGGASVYEQFLPLADRLLITEIPENPDGDARFPEIDPHVWRETDREDRDELSFVTYERRG
ncbi:MAG: dihydrofolate reductase [Halobacteriales archaeon]